MKKQEEGCFAKCHVCPHYTIVSYIHQVHCSVGALLVYSLNIENKSGGVCVGGGEVQSLIHKKKKEREREKKNKRNFEQLFCFVLFLKKWCFLCKGIVLRTLSALRHMFQETRDP